MWLHMILITKPQILTLTLPISKTVAECRSRELVLVMGLPQGSMRAKTSRIR